MDRVFVGRRGGSPDRAVSDAATGLFYDALTSGLGMEPLGARTFGRAQGHLVVGLT
jgi:hypothetical protein